MSSESLIQGLHEECKKAQAQAAAWEEIALALAMRDAHLTQHWSNPDKWFVKFKVTVDGDSYWQKTEAHDTPRAALLAWYASRKGG